MSDQLKFPPFPTPAASIKPTEDEPGRLLFSEKQVKEMILTDRAARLGDGVAKPHPDCDEACYYHCTENGAHPPSCGQSAGDGVATEAGPLNGIAATHRHDEGAVARCSYCRRYTLDRNALGEDRHQPVCECGKQHGWCGSFVKPGPDAKWSGKAPAATLAASVAQPGAAAVPDDVAKDAALRRFADDVINTAFEGGDLDGATIQEWAESAGLLKSQMMSEECGPSCQCAETVGFPSDCYRKTYTVPPAAPTTEGAEHE